MPCLETFLLLPFSLRMHKSLKNVLVLKKTIEPFHTYCPAAIRLTATAKIVRNNTF